VQTFLPYPDFKQSAQVLDKKRCWKQCVEAKQIFNVLEGNTQAWKNHPAVKMWVGYTELLKSYYNIFLHQSKEIHNVRTNMLYFDLDEVNHLKFPWWLGNENFHRAMRGRLIEKDRNFYLPLFMDDEGYNNGKYFWPVMENQTFRII